MLPGWLLPSVGAFIAVIAFVVALLLPEVFPEFVTVPFFLSGVLVIVLGLLGWLSTSLARTLRRVYAVAPIRSDA